MKKNIILTALLVCLSAISIHAQEDRNHGIVWSSHMDWNTV